MRRIYIYVVLAWAGTLAAGADVLVTTDGSEIQTKGPWQQKGKMVVFTLANGQLSALRAEDVDFDATHRRAAAPAAATSAAPPAAAERPKARIVITDGDVARGVPEAPPPANPQDGDAAATAEPDAAGEADRPAASASRVRVIAWDQEDPADGEGRVIFGTLRNDGNSFATGIELEIVVFADEGALAGTQSVEPVKTSLRPGESTTFRAQFRDVYSIGATRMTVNSLELEVGAAQDAPTDPRDG